MGRNRRISGKMEISGGFGGKMGFSWIFGQQIGEK